MRAAGASLDSGDTGDESGSDTVAQPDAGRLEAAARRSSGDESSRGGFFGYGTGAGQGDILAAVGPGGFFPEEFELLAELGTINIQQVTSSGLSGGCGGCGVAEGRRGPPLATGEHASASPASKFCAPARTGPASVWDPSPTHPPTHAHTCAHSR